MLVGLLRKWVLAFVCFSFFFFITYFLLWITCTRLSWPTYSFQSTLNSITVGLLTVPVPYRSVFVFHASDDLDHSGKYDTHGRIVVITPFVRSFRSLTAFGVSSVLTC